MIEILAHRGFWREKEEQNTLASLVKAFDMGFGIETDLRDGEGKLLLSHDIVTSLSERVEELFKIYQKHSFKFSLALNIKADGLQTLLLTLIKRYEIENYFVFDMSIPDALLYLKDDFKVFTRQSEYEKEPSFYEEACGVWLDEFHTHYIDEKLILEHLENGKQIAIVSPDLHKRSYEKEWEEYKKIITKHKLYGKIMLCTDKVLEAKEFFND
ncbi:hypothetical protein [Campylobacter vulpis]|uniref:hypothetical protein n=1 Tax=Campylobacter vulpis TaxID=1655500 RepID=UPI001C01D922|nr:hypothetical protein [Campylobacter vulpis]